MSREPTTSDDEWMRVTWPVAVALACAGWTVLAETATVIVSRGLQSPYDAISAYAAVAVLLGATVGRSAAWQVAAATLAAAAVFRPARRAARLALDRRFDRDGHAARLRVDTFLERRRSGTERPDRIQDVRREALRGPQLRLLSAELPCG